MIDIGKLTPEQTKQVLREIIAFLPDGEFFEVLDEQLTNSQKEELRDEWFNADRI